MEVILIKDMENLGYANDIVNVKPGYANKIGRASCRERVSSPV